jgi:ketosteroid isomerase-like protein
MFCVIAAAALAVATPAGSASAAAPERSESCASLIAFADAFDRAQLSKDAAALDRMTSDNLIFIDSAGMRRDKAAFIAGWTAPGDRYEPIVLVDRTVTLLGEDSGIVGAEVTLRGVSGGSPFASRFRFADTFERTNGRWRAVHIQVTRIP